MKKGNIQVLITGVAGFIGSHLLDFLLDETVWKVHGVDDLSTGNMDNIGHRLPERRFTFLQQDCSRIESLKPYDCIFHLAALPRIQPSFMQISAHVEANLLKAVRLIELMTIEKHYPRFVYAGSSAVYGTPDKIPTGESAPIRCMNPYAFQKYEVEKYLEIISTVYPLDYVTLRIFNPYGDRSYNPCNAFNAYSPAVGIFINRKKEGLPLQITGTGKQRRDFVDVRDVVRAMYLAAIHPRKLNTHINIGHGSSLSILELAKMISDKYEFIAERNGEAAITHADISKAKKILQWEPVLLLENYLLQRILSPPCLVALGKKMRPDKRCQRVRKQF